MAIIHLSLINCHRSYINYYLYARFYYIITCFLKYKTWHTSFIFYMLSAIFAIREINIKKWLIDIFLLYSSICPLIYYYKRFLH